MLDLNFPDKVLAGVHQSYTFTSDEGAPSGSISVDGKTLDHRILTLGPPKDEPSGTNLLKYKVTFFLPEDALGKALNFDFRAGESSVKEDKDVVDA